MAKALAINRGLAIMGFNVHSSEIWREFNPLITDVSLQYQCCMFARSNFQTKLGNSLASWRNKTLKKIVDLLVDC